MDWSKSFLSYNVKYGLLPVSFNYAAREMFKLGRIKNNYKIK